MRRPDFLPAYREIARLLADHGETGRALQWLSEGLVRAWGDAGERGSIAQAFAVLITRIPIDRWHPELDRDLGACLREEAVEHQMLARPVATLLLLKYPGAWSIQDSLADDPLLLDFLTRCINVEPRLEARLVALRRASLDRYADPTPVRLTAALALQAFAGEYVWPVSAAETERLIDPDLPVLPACLYRPLVGLDAMPTPDDPLVALLIKRIRHDLERERELAAAMPTLAAASHDAVSSRVRRQYEENPYPRWRAPPTPSPSPLREVVAALPGVGDLPAPPWRVLVAGCGTGYEAIDLARRDPDAAITALDLSRASLAYGTRMAEALGVTNVAFVQGDILDLPALPERFDMVSSTGVLHHMDDPAAGLHALAKVTRPGGVIRLALYSERARGPIRLAHEAIARLGLDATPEGIRAFRAHVLSLPDDDPLSALKHSDDFYSSSGCRDLLFHVREHWFTPPRVGDLLESAGLRLIALDAPPPAMEAFCTAYGERADRLDLALWDAVEARHPTLFVGMYHLWCQA